MNRKSLSDCLPGGKGREEAMPVVSKPAFSFADLPMLSNPYLWPLVAAASASGAAAGYFSQCARLLRVDDGERAAPPEAFWLTPNG